MKCLIFLIILLPTTAWAACNCPYDRDSAGRICGNRSAWSKPGGKRPICYESDIPIIPDYVLKNPAFIRNQGTDMGGYVPGDYSGRCICPQEINVNGDFCGMDSIWARTTGHLPVGGC